jgi:hypothetical protein
MSQGLELASREWDGNKPEDEGDIVAQSASNAPLGTATTEQEKEHRTHDSVGTSPTSSPDFDDNGAEGEQQQDLEALATVQSSSPPYSVFSRRKKHFIVFLAAWGGFFSPLSANIYFPALTSLTREYNVSSTLMNLTLTSYMIFQGLAPTIFGDLADMA